MSHMSTVVQGRSLSWEALYDHGTRIGKAGAALYRQMDPEDFAFAEREAASSWRIAPPSRNHFAAHAHQNAAQSRIHRAGRETHNNIKVYCGRVFLNPTGKEHHLSTARDVPLGKQIQQTREC